MIIKGPETNLQSLLEVAIFPKSCWHANSSNQRA